MIQSKNTEHWKH